MIAALLQPRIGHLARVQTQSDPERDGSGKGDGRLIVAGELVVAGCDAAEVLEATEHGFDEPAVAVALLVIFDGPLAVASSGDDGDRALISQRRAKVIGVVSSIRDDTLHADRRTNQQVGPLDVRRIARRQREEEWSSEDIDERMDFRRTAAARDANGVGLSPPFPPPAQRWALI